MMMKCKAKNKTSGAIIALLLLQAIVILSVFDQQRDNHQGLVSAGSEAEFEELIDQMERDVLDFADEAERAFTLRCDPNTFQTCTSFKSFDECTSEFPSATCPGGLELTIPRCGEPDEKCGGLFDYSISVTRMPEELADGYNRNPTDNDIKETICYTRELDEWLVNKHASDASFWKEQGSESPSKYYGSRDGVFRIYPARQSKECGKYDPRKRPWYIAASSGPKNIILILDTSGSMRGYTMTLLKSAASQIISTLTVADRIAIVEFNREATVMADNNNQYMYQATKENKEVLLKRVDGMYAEGATNFYKAFEAAFDLLEDNIRKEYTVNCHTAILFLTDGEMTDPVQQTSEERETKTLNLVTSRVRRIESLLQRERVFMLLTYSLSSKDMSIHKFPKRLACETTEYGVWSKIVDEEELVESLTSYYLLFALGLSENDNFVAWVEPYRYATNDQLGTTASAPVYDRSVIPNVLIGVTGFDFTMSAFENALGVEKDSDKTLEKIVERSQAVCPRFNLTTCVLEAFRRQSLAGDEALCNKTACSGTNRISIEPPQCDLSLEHYPSNLWDNVNYIGMSYEERTCCLVGETQPSDECPDDTNGGGGASMIILGSVLGAIVVILVVVVVYQYRKRCGSCQVNHVEAYDDEGNQIRHRHKYVSGAAVSKPQNNSQTCVKPSSQTGEQSKNPVLELKGAPVLLPPPSMNPWWVPTAPPVDDDSEITS